MNERQDSRRVWLASGLFGCLLAAGTAWPGGQWLWCLLPAPLTVLFMLRQANTALLLSALAGLALAGTAAALAPLWSCTLAGTAWMGHAAVRQARGPWPFLPVITLAWVMAMLAALAWAEAHGLQLSQAWSAAVSTSMQANPVWQQMAISERSRWVEAVVQALLQLFPALMALSALAITLINLWLAKRLSGRHTAVTLLNSLHLPPAVAAVCGLALLYTLGAGLHPVPILYQWACNILLVGAGLFSLQGCAWVHIRWQRWPAYRRWSLALAGFAAAAALGWLAWVVDGVLTGLLCVGLWDCLRRLFRETE
ncbi:MAG: DUF2232 domain-containing protein [Alicyclobacillus sp.]|nr:DUF2232 domain-containing protein [Alicyclobacillus sp.]